MATTATPDIKEKVRERYADIALQGSNCCGPAASSCCEDTTAEMSFADYSAIQSDVISESDLGLGCGTPTLSANFHPGETVLDLGSGGGIDVFLAAKAVGPDGYVIGVDMTPEMLALARSNAEKGGFKNVEFRKGELDNLPVVDNSIDVILSNCVINLTPDKGEVFEQMQRVLKSGGRFSISDIVTYGDVPANLREDIALWTGCIAGAMDREAYLELIRSKGFPTVRIEKETLYDESWLPDEWRQKLGLKPEDRAIDFGIASVTLVGEK